MRNPASANNTGRCLVMEVSVALGVAVGVTSGRGWASSFQKLRTGCLHCCGRGSALMLSLTQATSVPASATPCTTFWRTWGRHGDSVYGSIVQHLFAIQTGKI